MYMIKLYKTPSDIIHIYTVHNILLLTNIIPCYHCIIIAHDIIDLLVEHDYVPFFSRIASQITNIITIGYKCYITVKYKACHVFMHALHRGSITLLYQDRNLTPNHHFWIYHQ